MNRLPAAGNAAAPVRAAADRMMSFPRRPVRLREAHGGPALDRAGRRLRRRHRASRKIIRIFDGEQLAQGVRKRLDLRTGVDPGDASKRRHDATLAKNAHARRQLP